MEKRKNQLKWRNENLIQFLSKYWSSTTIIRFDRSEWCIVSINFRFSINCSLFYNQKLNEKKKKNREEEMNGLLTRILNNFFKWKKIIKKRARGDFCLCVHSWFMIQWNRILQIIKFFFSVCLCIGYSSF